MRISDCSSDVFSSDLTPIQAASRPMLLVDMEILWRGGREGISDAWRGKKLSGVVRPVHAAAGRSTKTARAPCLSKVALTVRPTARVRCTVPAGITADRQRAE